MGSNVSTAAQVSTRERFYLNTPRPAPINGTITHFRYCYYGEEDSDRNIYQALMALYRPEPGSGTNYQRITDTVSVIKRTPLSEVPQAEALLPGFNCDSIELEESVQVLLGDVIGACIYDTFSSIDRLDVVSESEDGYFMLYNSADDEDCENRVLPELVIGSNLEKSSILRILHIFAEICKSSFQMPNNILIATTTDLFSVPADTEITAVAVTTVPSTSQGRLAILFNYMKILSNFVTSFQISLKSQQPLSLEALQSLLLLQ